MLLINCAINIIIGTAVITNSLMYIRQHIENNELRFLRHMILYIASYIIVKIIPLFYMSLGKLIGDKKILTIGMAISGLVWFPSNLIFFITRLCEPHIREHIKEYWKDLISRLKVWFYSRKKEDVKSLNPRNKYLLSIEILDDRKLMKIEQIFIAVSVSYTISESHSRDDVSSWIKRPKDEDEIEYEVIKHSNLDLLNDDGFASKCNIHLDHTAYIEYKRYGVQSFQRFMDNIENKRAEPSQPIFDRMQVPSSQPSSDFSAVNWHDISK
jgi:hypothetical protein